MYLTVLVLHSTSDFASAATTRPKLLAITAPAATFVASIFPLLLWMVNPRPVLVTRMSPNRLTISTDPRISLTARLQLWRDEAVRFGRTGWAFLGLARFGHRL